MAQAKEDPEEEPLIEGGYDLVTTLEEMGFSRPEIKPYFLKYAWYLKIGNTPEQARKLILGLAQLIINSRLIKTPRINKKKKPRH